MCLSARFTKFLKMGDHRHVICILFVLRMKADVMTPHSTVGSNREVIKSQPEEVVTKVVGPEADAMSTNSIVSLNQELMNSQPEAIVYKGSEARGARTRRS